MAQLNLQPCAVQMNWLSNEPLTGSEWENLLCKFLNDLGKNCIVNGGSLVGHIKGNATVAGSPCLQLSLVSLNQPVFVGGSVPDGSNELQITLNVLVFGISADGLTAAINTSHDQTLKSWAGSIDVGIRLAKQDYPLAVHGEAETCTQGKK